MAGCLAALLLGLTALTARAADAPASAAATAGPQFDVLEFEIHGNTVLPVAMVEQAVTPHLGPQRGMAGVEAARAALDRAYQQAGFLSVVVDVPEQRVDQGVVQLRVLEGSVAQLRVTGARYFSQGWIRDKVPALAPGQVPDFNAVQAQLAALNRTAERRVQPLLSPGTEPGTLNAELRVEDRLPLAASLTLNNRHAANTVPWRLMASLRYDNLFQREHSLSITAITAPEAPRQSRVLVLNYAVPAEDGGRWTAQLVSSDSLVEPLGSSVIGKGSTLGLRRSWPLPGAGSLSHNLSLGIDYKRVQQRIIAGSDVLSSPVRYLPLSAAWSGAFIAPDHSTQFDLTLTLANRAVLRRTVSCAGQPDDQFSCAQRDADGSFMALRADLRHERQIGGWRLGGRLALQRATGALVSGEQFALGGADTVRGHLESSATGDQAWLVSLSLRSPNQAPRLGLRSTADLVASAFVDAGGTQLLAPALGQSAHRQLAGAGLGLALRLGGQLDGNVDLAWPLHRSGNTLGDPRLHAQLQWRF
jgi:hemolysin activation/secretion protein